MEPTGIRKDHLTLSPVDRFWSKVELIPFHPCWEWIGTTVSSGKLKYGQIRIKGRNTLAHRYSYEIHVGTIKKGLKLDHLCRNTTCVRPDHLEAVSQKTNVLRGFGIAAVNSKKTHCINGHEFTIKNTGTQRGGRYCIACSRISGKKYKQKMRALKCL